MSPVMTKLSGGAGLCRSTVVSRVFGNALLHSVARLASVKRGLRLERIASTAGEAKRRGIGR